MFSKTVLIAIFAAVLCQLSEGNKYKPDYEGCGAEFQCYGMPNKCVDDKSCQVLLKTKPLSWRMAGSVQFILNWERPCNSNDSWVAAALSTDDKMGDDAATLFTIGEDYEVQYQQGVTYFDNKTKTAGFKPEDVPSILVLRYETMNGLMSALWDRPQKTSVGPLSIDMKAQKYYIFLAYGPVKNAQILHHSHAWRSETAIKLE